MQKTVYNHRSLGLCLLTLCASFWLLGCVSKPVTVDAPPPRMHEQGQQALQGDTPETMLDWHGTYQALLPCDGCDGGGIAISVQLRDDKTAVVRERRVGGDLSRTVVPSYTGPFSFDPVGGSLISLRRSAQEPVAYKFFVAEGWIEMRERATGAALKPSHMYRLRKTSEPVN